MRADSTHSHVIIAADGGWWRVPIDKWVKACKIKKGLVGIPHIDIYELADPPKGFKSTTEGDRVVWWAPRNVLFVRPLYWEAEDYDQWITDHHRMIRIVRTCSRCGARHYQRGYPLIRTIECINCGHVWHGRFLRREVA